MTLVARNQGTTYLPTELSIVTTEQIITHNNNLIRQPSELIHLEKITSLAKQMILH